MHNITLHLKASSCYDSENWIINKRHAQKLVAVEMGFLRPRNGLQVNLIEGKQLYQNSWLEHPGRMDRQWHAARTRKVKERQEL
jgi:hypothetical protein